MDVHNYMDVVKNSTGNVSVFCGNDSIENTFVNPFNNRLTRILFILCYGAVFAMCVIGNTMVLIAIASSPRLRSMTNFFLANLAVADFCVGVFCVLPNLSTFLSQNWILGRAMCKIYYYVWNVSYTASVVILTVIAVERYIAIIYPLKAKHLRTRKKLVAFCIIIWTVAVIYNIPYLIFYDTVSISELNIEFCYFNKYSFTGLKGLSVVNIFVWFLLPLVLIGVLYTRVGMTLWKEPVGSTLRLRPTNSRPGSERSQHSCEDSHTLSDTSIECEQQTDTLKYSEENPKQPLDSAPKTRKVKKLASNSFTRRLTRNFTNSVSNKFRSSCKTEEACFSRINFGRRKVIRLLIAVVISFAVCVLPHHLKVINHFWNIVPLPHSVDVYFSPVSFIVLYLNNSLNPVLYALFSTNFRRAFSAGMTRLCARTDKQVI